MFRMRKRFSPTPATFVPLMRCDSIVSLSLSSSDQSSGRYVRIECGVTASDEGAAFPDWPLCLISCVNNELLLLYLSSVSVSLSRLVAGLATSLSP